MHRHLKYALAVAAAALCTAGAAHAQPAAKGPQTAKGPPTIKATLEDPQGKQIGTATLLQTPAGVLVQIDAKDLPPGEHALHFHQKGVCDGKDGFKSAGDHFAQTKKAHGYLGKGGPHAGDMPNQFVAADGTLRAEVLNPNVKLTRDSLLGAAGSALVIHAKPDDYKSQPSGDAGDRIACAVIRKPAQSESKG